MTCRRHIQSTLVIVVFLLAGVQQNAQPALSITNPIVLEPPQVLEALRFVRTYTELGLSPSYEVRDEKRFDGAVLAVEVLIFHPNSRLVLGRGVADREDRYILARKIRVLGQGPTAPIITWDRDDTTQRIVPRDPPAPSGSFGGAEGADGQPGAEGRSGNSGYPGRSAPTLYVFASEFEGSSLLIDMNGQDGGAGGIGQAGGAGGPGRTGPMGISSFFDCRRGGGNGGNGGSGGNGGRGGAGGRGGNGGTVILLSTQAGLGQARAHVLVSTEAGKGGAGGEGGEPGPPGTPGLGGSGDGFCGGGAPGKVGVAGKRGERGANGDPGAPGRVAVAALPEEQLAAVRLRP